jgi:hypothetical protein
VGVRDVICISRTGGAGGEEIGRLVAERLGFRYVDEDVVLAAAERAGLDPAVVADEERRKPLFEGLLGYLREGADTAVPDVALVPGETVRGYIRDAVREIAGEGRAVIVAHAASYALAAEARALRVLVTAPDSVRAARVAAVAGIGEQEGKRAVGRGDTARADYLKRFYGVSQELPAHYDLVLNTERLSVDEAVAVVAQASGVRTGANASGV